MPHYTDNKCSRCGSTTSPELLTVKKAVFSPLKQPRRILKSRSVEWLCESCLARDPDYQRESYSGPGNKSAPLERVRSGEILE